MLKNACNPVKPLRCYISFFNVCNTLLFYNESLIMVLFGLNLHFRGSQTIWTLAQYNEIIVKFVEYAQFSSKINNFFF